jgi:lipopolysaccharide transport protein LptA
VSPRALCGFAAAAALLASSGAARAQKARDEVDVTADRLVVDQSRRTARFEGNVAARYGELTLTCAEMTATYGEHGAVTSLEARGRVTVRRGDAVAEAGFAKLDANRKLLVLEGAPTVTRGPHRLKGKRISVHLDSGAIEVLEAQGTFALPLGEGR